MSGMIFERAHVFYSPNKVLFGPNTVKSVGNEALQLGGKKVLIITDPGVVQAKLIEPVKASLEAVKVPYVIYDQVKAGASSLLCGRGRGETQIREMRPRHRSGGRKLHGRGEGGLPEGDQRHGRS